MDDLTTLIIGVPDRYRGAPLEEELRRRGRGFERVDGVIADAATLARPDVVDRRGTRLHRGRPLSAGEVGAALAHHRAHVRASRSATGWTLVLEDDARDVDLDVVERIVAGLGDVAEPTVVLGFAYRVLRRPEPVWSDDSAAVYDTILTPYSAVGYLINAAGARLLAQNTLPLLGPADWPMRVAGRLRYLVAEPGFARVVHGDSVVGERPPHRVESPARRVLRRLYGLSHLLWCLEHRSRMPYRAYWAVEVVQPLVVRRQRHVPWEPLGGRWSAADVRAVRRHDRLTRRRTDRTPARTPR